jgi:hypothetical protein
MHGDHVRVNRDHWTENAETRTGGSQRRSGCSGRMIFLGNATVPKRYGWPGSADAPSAFHADLSTSGVVQLA